MKTPTQKKELRAAARHLFEAADCLEGAGNLTLEFKCGIGNVRFDASTLRDEAIAATLAADKEG